MDVATGPAPEEMQDLLLVNWKQLESRKLLTSCLPHDFFNSRACALGLSAI